MRVFNSRRIRSVLAGGAALSVGFALVLATGARGEPPVSESDQSRELVEALALYPEETRDVVLEACTVPALIEAVAEIQRRSSADFREIVSGLGRDEQAMVWDLMRFPGLVDELVAGGPKSDEQLRRLVADRPEAIRESAIAIGRDQRAILEKIVQLEAGVSDSLEQALAPHPLQTQATFRALIALPEVLSALVQNPDITRRVGAIYLADPDATRRRLTLHAEEVARRNEEALDDWKRELESDPEALAELTESAEEFAREEALDTSVSPPDDSGKTEVRVVYYAAPYPYWYGYPHWYGHPYWYRRPYYYHGGFYYGPHGRVVVVSTGSYRFGYWHFRGNAHHVRYSHLHARYVHHGRRHDRYYGGGSAVARDWVSENRDRLPKDWSRDDGRLSQRFSEYGRFEERYAKANRERSQSRQEFLRTNADRYPGLRGDRMDRATGRPGESARDRAAAVDRPSRSERSRQADRSREPRPSGGAEGARSGRSRESREVSRGRASEQQRRQQARDNHSGSWRNSGGGRPGHSPGRGQRGGGRPAGGGGRGGGRR